MTTETNDSKFALLVLLLLFGTQVVAAAQSPTEFRLSRKQALDNLQKLHAEIKKGPDGNVISVGFQDSVALADSGFEPRDLTNDDLRLVRSFPEIKQLRVAGCANITDRGLESIRNLTKLERLDLHGTSTTGPGIQRNLAGMTHLRRLKLASVPVGDDDIKFLTRFKELQNLNLWATNITDRGLKNLAESTSIEVLLLGKIAISDNGVQHVSKMKSLKVLNFSDVPITDAAIDSLCQLTQLKAIRLIRTKITEDGASRLRAALPSCRVVHAPSR